MTAMTGWGKGRDDFFDDVRKTVKITLPLRPSVGGGLGVFAFHDVPSRRFAPRFVYF